MFENIYYTMIMVSGVLGLILAVISLIYSIIRTAIITRKYKKEIKSLYENREAQSAEEVEMKIIKCDKCGMTVSQAQNWCGFDLCDKCAKEMEALSAKVKDAEAARDAAYEEYKKASDNFHITGAALEAAKNHVTEAENALSAFTDSFAASDPSGTVHIKESAEFTEKEPEKNSVSVYSLKK